MLLLLAGCAPQLPGHGEFTVGMERAEVLDLFGEPQSKRSLTKTGDNIWGPIEDFWPRVPIGARVEIWSYDSLMKVDGLGKKTLAKIRDQISVN